MASGLGAYFDLDPILFRIGFIVLSLAGGAGVIAYIVAWIVMPPSTGEASMGEHAVRRIRHRSGRWHDVPAWVAVALLIIGAALVASRFDVFHPEIVWGAVLIGLGVLLFHHASTARRDDAHPPAATDTLMPPPPPPTPGVGAGAGVLAPDDPTVRMEPAPRRRERSGLGWATVGLAMLATGVAAILDNAHVVSLSLAQYLAVALVIVAVGLLVGTWAGRARWLTVLGVLLIPPIVLSSLVIVPLRGGFGDRFYQPVGSTAGPYRLVAGNMTVDLTRMRLRPNSASVTATIVAGQMRVIVPAGDRVMVHGRVGAGELELFGRWTNGLKLDERRRAGPVTGPELDIGVAVSFGQIIVQRRGGPA